MPADTYGTHSLPGLSPAAGKLIIARFDGEARSSAGRFLALPEVEGRLGVAQHLAACLKDPRSPDSTRLLGRVLGGAKQVAACFDGDMIARMRPPGRRHAFGRVQKHPYRRICRSNNTDWGALFQ